jgi:hypothetical protein
MNVIKDMTVVIWDLKFKDLLSELVLLVRRLRVEVELIIILASDVKHHC